MSLVIKAIHYPEKLDNKRIAQFHREIEAVVNAGANIILIDFKNVSFISSPGLIPLVSAFRKVKVAGCKFFVCSMNAQVRMLFELTGLNQVFETLTTNRDDLHKPVFSKNLSFKPSSRKVSQLVEK
ncbi:MAG: STAS domain-containing protein [Microcoleus vaginatus WJT46-NPBG5]|jgi:anti-anti-sigma factor|nr:STAS domain-containing protein [Microcoleus vaginatus WJT46-NPBG5]